jgi:thiamine biosynthesis lipoprotein
MKYFHFFLVFSILLVFSTCKKEQIFKDYTLKGPVFGTTYKITYLNSDTNYQKSIDSLFLKMNQSLSTYMPNSDISKINKGNTNVIVDNFFVEVFEKSKRIFMETEGFFDPTVGNLVNAWGFGPKVENRNLTEEEVKAQMQFVGLDKVKLKNNFIVKDNPKIYLDFNSIAKGFGIDVIARFLESKKTTNYLVEIGGEIRTGGFKKGQQPWIIKLINPIQSNANVGFKNINLSNRSMATSGNYRKFRITSTGKKYVHTINPKTGYATESNLLSVSVIADLDCADVDAYATAFMAMGLEKTKSFLDKNTKLEVILLFTNTEGNLEEYTNYTYK